MNQKKIKVDGPFTPIEIIVLENLERINVVKITNAQSMNRLANELEDFLQKLLGWIEIVRTRKLE